MPHSLSSILGLGVVLLVCGGAFVIGAGRARWAAAITAGGVAASLIAQRLSTVWAPAWTLLGIDTVVLLGFVALAWRPKRGWPLAAAGLQGVTVALDLLKLFEPSLQTYTYLTAVALSTYGLLAVVAYGAWVSRRARRL